MMNEAIEEDLAYEDLRNDEVDLIDISAGDVEGEDEEEEEEEEENSSYNSSDKTIPLADLELIKFKEQNISYYKRFYANKSIYCVNSFKKWIYFGSINNNCYLYNNFDNDLRNFAHEGGSGVTGVGGGSGVTGVGGGSGVTGVGGGSGVTGVGGASAKVSLQQLKHQKYTDTVTNIKFSKSYKYIALCIYNGDIYIYNNNNMNKSEILNYNITNFKQNINNSNSLLHIYNWNVGMGHFKKEEEEWISEDMNFVNILTINDTNEKKDIEYFMFCPFNEEILLSIYLDSPNIYIWNIHQNTPISITYTVDIPTFINICNYDSSFYLIAGFHSGETHVYDYNVYSLKRRNAGRKHDARVKGESAGVEASRQQHPSALGSYSIKVTPEGCNGGGAQHQRGQQLPANQPLPALPALHALQGLPPQMIPHEELDNSNDVLCIDNNLANEIYVATHRNVIQICSVNTNSVISTYHNLHSDLVDYCLFNNKRNNIFASSSLDNSIIVYDYQCKKYINKFLVNYEFNKVDTNSQMEKGINFLKWINTNLLLFSSLNGNIYIYDIRSRQCIHQFYSHTDTIFNVHLSLHLYDQKNILSILTASDDRSSNMHFLDISAFI
ncbi:WD repeat-containing protein, putative [Plasmodium vivax]|uniref:WD repeat-containing protein, putative n=1 Tax=Plasmodium vivax TaxID=5855 RepID=A0A564ZTL2_PLAVI|nr:WD repeat-containing protein, putative [Plasmodium vivax]